MNLSHFKLLDSEQFFGRHFNCFTVHLLVQIAFANKLVVWTLPPKHAWGIAAIQQNYMIASLRGSRAYPKCSVLRAEKPLVAASTDSSAIEVW
jgi:hypothetical protein